MRGQGSKLLPNFKTSPLLLECNNRQLRSQAQPRRTYANACNAKFAEFTFPRTRVNRGSTLPLALGISSSTDAPRGP
jgi:hypothetical protein